MRRTAFGISGLLGFTALVALGSIIIDGFGLPPSLREEAEAERPSLASDDVVEHDWSENNKQNPIENSYFVIIQGKKVADRCSVTVEGLRRTKRLSQNLARHPTRHSCEGGNLWDSVTDASISRGPVDFEIVSKGRPTVVRESAVNLSTCEYLMEVGDMSAKGEEARKQIRPRRGGGTSSDKPNIGEPVSEGYHGDSEVGP